MMDSRQDLVVDALVQWTRGEGYGVITEIDDQKISVRWDDKSTPPQFVAVDPPLRRVEIAGKPLRRKSNGATVFAGVLVAPAPPVWQCTVITPNGSLAMVNVAEADLRPIRFTNPVERFASGEIGSFKKYRLREVTQSYRTLHRQNDLVSLGNVQVDIKPHQVGVVHKVISNYPHRFLLCDEVGLGKTIEAGMTLKELQARGGAKRVLAIVPPNLVGQWQFEMKSKFNVQFAVLNTGYVRTLEGQGYVGNPFTWFDAVICSSSWVANRPWAELCAEADWDLIIVDEAHHARSQRTGNRTNTTQLYRLVRNLSKSDHVMRRGMLLLTATPMQLNTHEIYSLVELLDPGLFPSEADFDKHRRSLRGLNLLVDKLRSPGFHLPEDDPGEMAEQVAEWLDLDVREALRRLTGSAEDLETLVKDLSDRHLLSQVLIRNRKSVVGGFMPRSAHRWPVELTAEEEQALTAVEAYVEDGYQLAEGAGDNIAGFVKATYQKLMASSLAAIRETLVRRRDKIVEGSTSAKPQSDVSLADRLDNDDDASDVTADYPSINATNREMALLEGAIASIELAAVDSKASALMEQLANLFAEHPDEKVLVFTQFRETQRYLADLIGARGWNAHLFHGQMKANEKDRAVVRFRDNGGPQVLISTEAGGEGRNLQFCHLLVNYDLPWNPMKVEQRIGRVDRIGQEHPVRIFNLWVKDTIEERILDVLENRIQVFQETVGGLDPILGSTESEIMDIMRQPAADRDVAIANLGERIENEIRQAKQAGELLIDFIMDTKSYNREIAERISGQPSPIDYGDMDRFIGQLLSDVRTHISETDGIYNLTFSRDFADAHRDSFLGGRQKQAVFRPDRQSDAEEIEFMAFGHRVVDAVVEQVLADDYEGATGTRRIPAGDDLSPVSGWLFTYQFTTPAPGVRAIEHLVPIFITDDGRVDTDLGRRIVERAYRFDRNEEEIAREDIPNNLDEAKGIAGHFAEQQRAEIQNSAEAQAAERYNREISRLETRFGYRRRAVNDRIAATQATLERFEASADENERRVIPIWQGNLQNDRELPGKLDEEQRRMVAEAETYRHPQVDSALKSLGRIEVVATE